MPPATLRLQNPGAASQVVLTRRGRASIVDWFQEQRVPVHLPLICARVVIAKPIIVIEHDLIATHDIMARMRIGPKIIQERALRGKLYRDSIERVVGLISADGESAGSGYRGLWCQRGSPTTSREQKRKQYKDVH